ncbi:MAG: hypothetical protein PHN78_00440 [Dehalococcoidales bacterium]|nr:hypothetical protein [Dehalococcoidales bacterium]
MLRIELVPDLDHCIETIARRKHAELTQILLGSEAGDTEAEEKLDILKLFLETADFRKLRSKSERQLIDGRNVRFTVYLEGGVPKCEMHVTQVNQQ